MELIDTHCHIQSAGQSCLKGTSKDLWKRKPKIRADDLILEANKAAVSKIICVGCDVQDSAMAVEFASTRPNCRASIGIHPHEAKNYIYNKAALAKFTKLSTHPQTIAIGECGLDYFYDHSSSNDQAIILKFQLGLATKLGLPVIFHVRDAFLDFWPIFDSYSSSARLTGVLHSFTDTMDNLHEALRRGLFIGVNGIVTFNKSPQLEQVYRAIPLSNLLLETDAPFLTPTPYRGTINEPKHIRRIAEFMSQLRDEKLDIIAHATTSNARQLFNV